MDGEAFFLRGGAGLKGQGQKSSGGGGPEDAGLASPVWKLELLVEDELRVVRKGGEMEV